MIVLKPDSSNNYPTIPVESSSRRVFLAGSIEMGVADDWQKKAEKLIYMREGKGNTLVWNPRRDAWDSTWEQKMGDNEFTKQVNWELNGLAFATHIIMYLDPLTKSPISLLELGIHADSGKLRVICPEGFYRKGNVDIVCHKYKIPQFDTLEAAIDNIFN